MGRYSSTFHDGILSVFTHLIFMRVSNSIFHMIFKFHISGTQMRVAVRCLVSFGLLQPAAELASILGKIRNGNSGTMGSGNGGMSASGMSGSGMGSSGIVYD
jgi:hypothetical protein